MSLVSIIVPSYNHASFLRERLHSIFNQTYCNYEVIILDDASTDNSLEIAKEFESNPKLRVISSNSINSGSVFRQWQKGIELALGEYIWIAESDDYCELEFLETVMQIFESNSNLALVYSGSKAINKEGAVLWNSPLTNRTEFYQGDQFIQQKMIFGNSVFNASMAVFKKSCLPSSLSQVLNFKFCGDWLFWILVAKQGEVASIGKHLNYFRNHDKDVSQQSFKSGLYFDEYIKLQKVLLEQRLISFFTYKKALYKRWQELKLSNLDDVAKFKLIHTFQNEFSKFELTLWLVYFNIWWPILSRIKNLVKKIF